jgi:hypothetical protein
MSPIMGTAFRRGGDRLRLPTNIKVRCLQIQRMLDEPTTANMYVNWRWAANLKPQVDLAVAQGANCVKFANSILAIIGGSMTRAAHNINMKQFLDYTVTKGIYVYWTLHYSEEDAALTDPATLAEAVAALQLLATYPNVIGCDITNESNIPGGIYLFSSCAQPVAVLRAAAPAIPLTGSVYVTTAASFTGGGANAFTPAFWAPLIDFWDFHPYYGSGDPSPGDLAAFRASATYKPFVIGECGQVDGAGQAAQTSRWTALGVLAGQADCLGVNGYVVADSIASPSYYGMYSNSPAFVEKTWISAPFHGWPVHA